VPEGEKIPAKKMAQAGKSSNPRMKRMVALAHTLKGMHHKADGGEVKDQSRYGDEGMDTGNDNQLSARMLLGPPRTANTPGYDTETSSARRPNPGPSRRMKAD
jgi:hypothetical protein